MRPFFAFATLLAMAFGLGCATTSQQTVVPAKTAAAQLIQRQVDAYNARNLDQFAAFYSDDVKIFRPPAVEPALSGKDKLREFYATKRFNLPALHAEILGRIAIGNKVVDQERIYGLGEQPMDAIVVYEVSGELIRSVWIYGTK